MRSAGAPVQGGGRRRRQCGRGGRQSCRGRPPVPGSVKYRVSNRRLWYSWQYVDAVRKVLKNKLMIKGIVDAEDARMAVEHGADAILVSNHGGRSMDYGPSTLEVLPEIVAAVNGRIPVVFDSGIRRGTDIFKALALGANAIQLGRTARWGLAAYGAAGAQRLIEILQQELVQVAAAMPAAAKLVGYRQVDGQSPTSCSPPVSLRLNVAARFRETRPVPVLPSSS